MNTPAKRSLFSWLFVLLAALVLFLHPKPGPGPGPGPVPPGPPPDPAGSFLVAVTDNETRTPEQASVLLSEDLGKWLIDKQIGWRVIDKGGAVFRDQGYDQLLAADGVSPSAVVLWAPGNASHKTAPMPATVDLLKQWVVGSPHTGPPFIEVDGEKRYLTCLPRSEARLMTPRGGEFCQVHAPIPRANWKEIDNRAKFPAAEWIYDQDGIGSCVGNGATAALRKARLLAGMSDVRLAPGCLYAQCNGGQDRGAVIADSLTALQHTGTISSKTLGSDQKPFYLKQLPANWKQEAARWRIEEAYHCANFDEMCTAVMLGYVVVYGMQVGGNFQQFTPEGVPGHSSGPGNHCMHADGLHKLASGAWALDNVNSWGAAWGPWKNGRCYLIEDHFLHGCQPDAYAVRTAVEDPLDPKKPPHKKVELEVVPEVGGAGGCPCYPCRAGACAENCPCVKSGVRCAADECTCAKGKAGCPCGGDRGSDKCVCKGDCTCIIAKMPPPGVKHDPQVVITKGEWVHNDTGVQCAWAAAETLCRHHGLKAGFGLAKSHGGGCPSAEVLAETLNRLGVQTRHQSAGNKDTKILKEACESGRGAAVGLGRQHVVCLVHFDEAAGFVKVVDNMGEACVEKWTMADFLRRWDGFTVVPLSGVPEPPPAPSRPPRVPQAPPACGPSG